VGLKSLKSLNLTNGYPNNNKNKNNKVKSKPLELRSQVKIPLKFTSQGHLVIGTYENVENDISSFFWKQNPIFLCPECFPTLT
jgi:hypothetical protein